MVDLDLAYLPALDLVRAIRTKAISPVEVVENSLSRIEEVQPKLNCFCFTYPEEAMARARLAEQAVMANEWLGPLHGLPIAIKDLTPTRGKTTTRGSRLFRDWRPDYDAVIVERLLTAGAIMVGKTTTPEFGLSGFTQSALWGTTRNPWSPEHTPGGSSGGSAVAVATGCVALAEGSDMGGSVRIPAALCGIVGLKPSFGRIPLDGTLGEFGTLAHFGPLARQVNDAALFLQCTQGPHDCDLQSLPAGPDIPLPLPTEIKGLRLALSIDLGYIVVDPEVRANTLVAADRLRELGAVVEEVELGWTPEINFAGWVGLFAAAAALVEPHLESSRDLLETATILAAEDGLKASAKDLKNVELVRSAQWDKLRPVLETFDALICPTMALPAPRLGASDRDYGYIDEQGYHDFEMTFPFNMMSPCPALTVPSGFTAAGLPTGLQIVGRRHDEVTALRIGAALEGVLRWAEHRPDV